MCDAHCRTVEQFEFYFPRSLARMSVGHAMSRTELLIQVSIRLKSLLLVGDEFVSLIWSLIVDGFDYFLLSLHLQQRIFYGTCGLIIIGVQLMKVVANS